MEEQRKETIGLTGSFKNKLIEKEYLQYEFFKSRKILTIAFLGCFFLYLLFLIPDYLHEGFSISFLCSFAVRMVSAGSFIALSIISCRSKSANLYIFAVTFCEFLFVITYFYLIFQSRQLNFFIKCMDIMLLTNFYFALPNKWLNASLATLFMIICFISLMHRMSLDNENFLYEAGLTYIFINYIISGIASIRINHFKRDQFLYRKNSEVQIYIDPLTKIFNREKFNKEITNMIELARKSESPLALILFDIDDFKKINDSYGHIVGDKVLKLLSDTVLRTIGTNGLLARWGGEEFVLVLPGTTLEQAADYIERVRKKLTDCRFGYDFNITCSYGITTLKDTDNSVSLFNRADKLMYQAKDAGKNIVKYQ